MPGSLPAAICATVIGGRNRACTVERDIMVKSGSNLGDADQRRRGVAPGATAMEKGNP